jgi:hypothetical protein
MDFRLMAKFPFLLAGRRPDIPQGISDRFGLGITAAIEVPPGGKVTRLSRQSEGQIRQNRQIRSNRLASTSATGME